jgi:hypothetical protein
VGRAVSARAGGDQAAAALLELARVSADMSKVDNRVTSNWIKLRTELRTLAAQIGEVGGTVTAHGELLERLDLTVTDLAARVSALLAPDGGGRGYQPIPAPRWWALTADERAEGVGRLESWVGTVYTPSYGRLAAKLPACWREHDLCLFTLDWLSEMHSILYLQPGRTAAALGGQAEWQTRLLPAAVDQMETETRACHGRHATRKGALQ